ncbi:hypothetical protein ABTQ33_05065 [Paucilactobacillus suebicus]|uniref:Uncharacterized protein n=1 Tax=Paucilactobacillus suebicus DSM 5007 = KCTC 3549 TaxID=1423807 RepID=A0A0R1W9Y1_9LACO|nr:hypothetical protein [Paucilactobacillus suebicus]KRM12313.1 hypothetical protein FD16_GL002498 [Paucilactobacillus suebicus DSM 5007 = KCTC 3549]
MSETKEHRFYYAIINLAGQQSEQVYSLSGDLYTALDLSTEHGTIDAWEKEFKNALIVVPAFQYYPHMPDPVFRLAKVKKLEITNQSQPFIEHTRSQFLLPPKWTVTDSKAVKDALHYIRHDYTTFSQQAIQSDFCYWRDQEGLDISNINKTPIWILNRQIQRRAFAAYKENYRIVNR